MKKLAIVLLLVAACSKKSDSNQAAPKPTEDVPAKTEPAKPEPAKTEAPKTEPAKTEPAKAEPVKAGEASQADKDLVGKVGEETKLHFKTDSGELVDVEVKTHLKGKTQVTDVIAAGKVLETIDSQVEKDDIHYEAKAAVTTCPEGVIVVQKVIKVTGKPDDNYEARIYAWDATAKQLTIKRSFKFGESYDPSKDG